MSRNDDELNEFIDEVTDGVYNLSCVQVIFKLVKQMQSWGDDRIKKIVGTLATEGIKISNAVDIWSQVGNRYSFLSSIWFPVSCP